MSEAGVEVTSGTELAAGRPTLRRWALGVALAGGSMVIGAVVAVAVLLVAGWRHVPDRRYDVAVFLTPSITAGDRAAVRARLERLPAVDGVRLETRQEAYDKFRKTWAGRPEAADVSADALPESFRVTTRGEEFDCGPVRGLYDAPGVQQVTIVAPAAEDRPGSELFCR